MKEITEHRVEQIPEASARHKFFLLFIFLLAYLIFYPHLQNSVAFRMAGVIITVLSVYAVSFRRSLLLIALALAVPALLEHLQILRADASVVGTFYKILTLAFDAFIVVVIFRRVFLHRRANSEAIFGSLCIYLLVGFSFSNLYWLIAVTQKHAFYLDPVTNSHSFPNRFDLIYYSFGTMTSLGASGITAVSDQARSLTAIEAILGVLYLAVLVARLMGAYHSRAADESFPPQPNSS
jgi:hypothetical protein